MAQMSGCRLEGNNVHALSYAMDVTRIGGVPEGSSMALMGFRCKEELERNVGGRRGMAE